MLKTEGKKASISVIEIIKYGIILLLIFKGYAEMAMTESVYYFADSLYGIVMWRGIACICLSILIALGFNVKKPINWIGIVLYYGIIFIYYFNSPLRINSWDLWRWQFYRAISIGTLVPLLTNAISEKKIRVSNVLSGLFMGFIFLFGVCSYIFDYDKPNNPFFMLIILSYSLIKMDKEKIEKWAFLFLPAVYLETMYIFAKGVFSSHSYGVIGAYYYGIFKSAPRFGEFVGYGAVCAITLFAILMLKRMKNKIVLIISVIAIVPIILMLIRINVRNPMLAIGIAMLIMLYIVLKQYKISSYYPIVIIVFALIPIIVLLIGFILLKKYPSGGNMSDLQGHIVLIRIRDYANRLVIGDVGEYDFRVFKKGTLIYVIDAMLSRRLSLAVLNIKNIGLTGKNGPFELSSVPDVFPHNAYLKYLYNYGLIVGSLVVSALILLLVNSIQIVKNTITNNKFYILPLLALFWQLYCVVIFTNEADLLFRNSAFTWLLLGSMTLGDYSANEKV